MPSVKVCLWNIQNYGQEASKYNGGRVYVANSLRNGFIARFVQQNRIDVLMIQEVCASPASALANLVSKLNALYPDDDQDWRASWCGSAIARRATDEVTSDNDLTYRTGQRTEGYAVVWRGTRDTFTMITGLHQIASGTRPIVARSPLNISLYGRPAKNNRIDSDREKFSATGGFTTAHAYPYDYDARTRRYSRLDHWPKLNYPGTARDDSLAPMWAQSRRPAYVVLKLSDEDKNLCPVGVYHAPSNQVRSSLGAFMSGLSREVYATNRLDAEDKPRADALAAIRRCVFGGDFNWSEPAANWPGDYQYFTADHDRAYSGGADCGVAPAANAGDNARRTTVQIVGGDNHNVPITGASNNDYLRHKIDLVFFPKGSGISASRINLLEMLRTDGQRRRPVYGECLKATESYMAWVERQVGNTFYPYRQRVNDPTGPQKEVVVRPRHGRERRDWVPIISGAWGGTFTNWATTRGQFGAGRITDARRAAEFVHIFISDHLPLVAEVPA